MQEEVHRKDAAPIRLDRPMHYRKNRGESDQEVGEEGHPCFEGLNNVRVRKEEGMRRVPKSHGV